MPTFYIKKGDTAPLFVQTLYDGNGVVVNLTSASVKLTLTDIRTGTALLNGVAATINNAVGGIVEYDWAGTDTLLPGWYRAVWTVTFGGGRIESFPDASGQYTNLVVIEP